MLHVTDMYIYVCICMLYFYYILLATVKHLCGCSYMDTSVKLITSAEFVKVCISETEFPLYFVMLTIS